MQTKQFSFRQSFESYGELNLEQPIPIPINVSLREYFDQLVAKYNVPLIAFETLYHSLKSFVEENNREHFQSVYDEHVDALVEGRFDVHRLCDQFDQAYRLHRFIRVHSFLPSEDDNFVEAYNLIIHSPQSHTLIVEEQSMAKIIGAEVDKRDRFLKHLEEDLLKETEINMQQPNVDLSATITRLHQTHVHVRDMEEVRMNSVISELKRAQLRKHRDLVFSLITKPLDVVKSPVVESRRNTMEMPRAIKWDSSLENFEEFPAEPWSESFTIQVGRQMRTTCEFRLIRLNPMDLLNNVGSTNRSNNQNVTSSSTDDLAERLSCALGLYSELNGLVILADGGLNAFRGIEKRLSEACERSTDFHFPELNVQLTGIQKTIDHLRITTLPSTGKQELSPTAVTSNFQPIHGDVFITKHSNLSSGLGGLAGVGGGNHVVFHLAYDPSCEQRENSRIRSGSPLHCAISAVLRTCFEYDITTLSLPVLLVPVIHEYMDPAWRSSRAESVFKAIKGALLELSMWHGQTIRSIQFLAPPELSDQEMESFKHIIESSFLQPVPVILSSNVKPSES